jgi:hypothetical protein
MHPITRIDVTTSTGNNGTNSNVYLGIGGREFLLDRPGRDDFQRNTNDHFVLGDANNVDSVSNPAQNDPRSPLPLDADDLSTFPLYIRLDSSGAWELNGVTVVVRSSQGTETLTALPDTQHLRLAPDSGLYLFFKQGQN